MKVLIIGAGEVGYQITKSLVLEEIDVVVIDRDHAKLSRISEELDVATIIADGCSPTVLSEVGADTADMLLAVTDSDESNMIACMVAKAMFNIPRKIARIRNPEFYQNHRILSHDNLDINPAISPEIEVANAIIRLIETPFAADVEDFEGGLVKVIGFRVPDDSKLVGVSFKNLKTLSPPKNFLVGIIVRDGRVIIPTGDDVIMTGDVLYMPVKKWEIGDNVNFLGASARPARKVMILGAGRIGYHIAASLEDKTNVKIIEHDIERCKFISQRLRKTVVLHGDGSDESLLKEENIKDMDLFVSVSNNEELNIMSSLLAKRLGVNKTITIVNRTDYLSLASGLGLSSVLSPRIITANRILTYIRRGDILSLTTVAEGKAEILEARIGDNSPLVGKTLIEAKLPKYALVGTIIRGDKIIIPFGGDVIHAGDKVIFFCLRQSLKKLEKLLV